MDGGRLFAWALRRRAQVSVERLVPVPVGSAFAGAPARALPDTAVEPPRPGRRDRLAALAAYLALSFVFNRDAVATALRHLRALR